MTVLSTSVNTKAIFASIHSFKWEIVLFFFKFDDTFKEWGI